MMGCQYLALDIPSSPKLFKRRDPLHLSHDGGLPLLIDAIRTAPSSPPSQPIVTKRMTRKSIWYDTKRKEEFNLRAQKREEKEMARMRVGEIKEERIVTPKSTKSDSKKNDDKTDNIEAILKEIGPHPPQECYATRSPDVKRKGKLRSLHSFPTLDRVLHSLEVLLHSDVFTHFRHIDSKGYPVFLSIDDLVTIKSAYLDSLLTVIFSIIVFEVPNASREPVDKIVRYGGGATSHNDSESKIVNVRLTTQEVDLMQLPAFSAYDSYQISTADSVNPRAARDIREFSLVPRAPTCRKMLDDLSKHSGEGITFIRTSNGQIFTKNDLNNIINHEFNIKAKEEIKNERKWLREFSEGKTSCPDGLIVRDNVIYIQNAVSYLQTNGEKGFFHGLRFDSVRGLMNNQYMTDEYLAHMSSKINNQSPPDVFCFFYDRMNNNEYTVPDIVFEDYKKSGKKDIRKLVVFCRVRNVVSQSDGTSFTHIGDFGTDLDNLLVADHYVMVVFDSDFQTVFYCDSLGWKAPPDFADFVSSISESFFSRQLFKNTHYAHTPVNSDKISEVHVCKVGSCSKYYPLQKCGTVCGVSVTITAVIAIFSPDVFRKMFCPEESVVGNIQHLRDISKYSSFFRSVLLRWLVEDISMDDILPSSVISSVISTSCIDTNNFEINESEVITPSELDSTVKDSHHMIPLTEQNKKTLLSENNFELAMLATEISSTCDQLGAHCGEKIDHVHCTLCDNQVIPSTSITQHVNAVHKKHGVYGEKYFYWPCKTKGHTDDETRSHYHCGKCEKVVSQKTKFLRHLKSHSVSKKRKTGQMYDADDLLFHPPSKKAQQGRDAQCKICNKIYSATYLKTHMRSHDKTLVPQSVLVDKVRGLYMVPKSTSHGGIRYPIHVQKIMRDNVTKYSCEHPKCIDHRDILSRSGSNWCSCSHLDLVDDKTTLIQEVVTLSNEILNQKGGPMAKTFKEEKRQECSDMNIMAMSMNHIPVVPFFQNGDHVHLSVWSGGEDDDPCYKYGRVIVTYDIKRHKLSCKCALLNKIPCLHKAMGLWFLHQTKIIASDQEPLISLAKRSKDDEESFLDQDDKSSLDTNIDSMDESNITESFSRTSTEYPPKNDIDIEPIIEYIHTFKRYSKENLDNINSIDFRTKFPDKKIVPAETECKACNVPLNEPLRVNKNAYVYTFYGKIGPYSSFVKKCPSCRMFYRYQECTDGIHNVDDNLFVEITFLKFLKENMQEHNTIGGTIKALNNSHNKMNQVSVEKIRAGYFMYDVLSTVEYEFSCVKCGHHPDILVADLNRKLAFRCDLNDVEDVDDPDDETAGDVDCDEFWKNVECGILASAFPNAKLEKYTIKPSFKSWSPYMGKGTRKGNMLINSEYKKLNRKTGEIDSEFLKEMSEDRFFDLISQKTHKELKAIAKEMKMTHLSGKSKYEILNDLKRNFSANNENFGKIFLKLGGFSGGYLTYNCIHGISYYLKMPIRAEGPRDYIDGMLDMKHPPKVTVIDMPHYLVRHSKNRQADIRRTKSGNSDGELFYPFDGKAGDHEDPETLRLAQENKFQTTFPCLNEVDPGKNPPISLVLFDRLHENNSKSEIENLRKLQCVKELYGKFNSQVAEQLHKSFNANKRFLNSMSPHHFIFNLRSLINHRNILKNQKIINFEENQGFKHFQDQFGRIQVNLGIHKKISVDATSPPQNYTNEGGKIDFNINAVEKDSTFGNSTKRIPHSESNSECVTEFDLSENSEKKVCVDISSVGEKVVTLNAPKLRLNSESLKRVTDCLREKLGKSASIVQRPSQSKNVEKPVSVPDNVLSRNIFDVFQTESVIDESAKEDIISKFNKLMRTKFNLNGFFDDGQPVVREKNEFVQVLKISTLQYVTITNTRFTDKSSNSVSIYDPCWTGMYEQKHFDIIASKASKLMDTNGNNSIDFVVYQPIHSEKTESYLYAILFAHTIARKIDPFTITIKDRKKLDSNIRNFLRTGTLGKNITFQPSMKTRTVMSQRTETLCSFCFCCNQKNEPLVKCNKCNVKFHQKCIDPNDDLPRPLVCPNCTNNSILPDLALEIIFENYCSNSDDGGLTTLKLVCKRWNNLANIGRFQIFAKLDRCIRKIESKPDYHDVFVDIYRALKWLLRYHKCFIEFPRLPMIIFSNNDFLEVAHSFLIRKEPDRTYNNIDQFQSEAKWYADSMKNIMARFEFGFDHLCDMKFMINSTRDQDIHINASGPPISESDEDLPDTYLFPN